MDEQNKTPVDDGRKNALLRYIAILFAVAFLFVLLSLVMQMRDSRATISELNAASASALKNAETLQDGNRQLQEENAPLRAVINGRLHSVPEDFYDGMLLSRLPEAGQTIRLAELLGRTLGSASPASGIGGWPAGRKLWRQRAGSVWNGTPGASTTAR